MPDHADPDGGIAIEGLGDPIERRQVRWIAVAVIGNITILVANVAIAPLGTEGDSFLLGVDLVKDPARLWAAYNDAAGVTADFNLNVLRMLNRELEADFDLDHWEHAADWDPENEWIDIRVRSTRAQRVTVADLDLAIDVADGEEVRTEVSAKFRLDGIRRELEQVGLEFVDQWTDAAGDFALTLAIKP